MKTIFILLVILSLSACTAMGEAIENMTEQEKQTAWIVGAVIISGVLISTDNDATVIRECHGHSHEKHCDD